MFVKQLSVFIENREGRLDQVTEVLASNKINIQSFSLADTSEYGLLRMIVSEPEKAKEILKENGFSAMLSDVLAVKLDNETGMLQNLLKAFSGLDINIEYMYVLATGKDDSSIVIKVNNPELAYKALKDSNIEMYEPEAAYKVNQ